MRCRLALLALTLMPLAAGIVKAQDTAPTRDYADPEQLAVLISGQLEPYNLVDVRSGDEYTASHIPTAVNIPWDQIADTPPTADRSALIVVYCASGSRSSKAAAALRALGYTRVVDFGAVSRWKGTLIGSPDPRD